MKPFLIAASAVVPARAFGVVMSASMSAAIQVVDKVIFAVFPSFGRRQRAQKVIWNAVYSGLDARANHGAISAHASAGL
jgi:hypothetical protein